MPTYKYSLREDYFDNIDTEAKAYWLGYILADGSVMTRKTKDARHYGLVLSSIDLDHLEKFKSAIEYTGVIFIPKRKGGFANSKQGYRLVINRVSLSKSLLKYKFDPINFSLPNIETSLIRHLIRGYFDGDGSVYSWVANEVQKTRWGTYYYKRFHLESSIIAANPMLLAMQAELSSNDIKTRIKKSKTEWMKYLVVTNKPDLHRFRYYLYNDSSVFLQRKFDKWHDTPPEWETARSKSRICGKPVIQTQVP